MQLSLHSQNFECDRLSQVAQVEISGGVGGRTVAADTYHARGTIRANDDAGLATLLTLHPTLLLRRVWVGA